MEKYIHRGEPAKLVKSVKEHCPSVGYTVLMNALKNKDVKINGQRIKDNADVYSGDCVEIYAKTAKTPFNFIESIVYSDDFVIIIDKPQGIETAQAELLLQGKYGLCFAVHRLDRNTCGLNIFARSEEAKLELERAFKNNFVSKYYIAEVFGQVRPEENILTAYLFKDVENSRAEISEKPKSGYAKIITQYKVLKSQKDSSLLEIKLVTGKTHQIRAHLAFIGHPVIGDGKYGTSQINKTYSKTRQQLKSYKLQFSFPLESILAYLNDKVFELDKIIR